MATYPNPWEALIQSGMAGYQQQQVRRQQQAQHAEEQRRLQAEMNLRREGMDLQRMSVLAPETPDTASYRTANRMAPNAPVLRGDLASWQNLQAQTEAQQFYGQGLRPGPMTADILSPKTYAALQEATRVGTQFEDADRQRSDQLAERTWIEQNYPHLIELMQSQDVPGMMALLRSAPATLQQKIGPMIPSPLEVAEGTAKLREATRLNTPLGKTPAGRTFAQYLRTLTADLPMGMRPPETRTPLMAAQNPLPSERFTRESLLDLTPDEAQQFSGLIGTNRAMDEAGHPQSYPVTIPGRPPVYLSGPQAADVWLKQGAQEQADKDREALYGPSATGVPSTPAMTPEQALSQLDPKTQRAVEPLIAVLSDPAADQARVSYAARTLRGWFGNRPDLLNDLVPDLSSREQDTQASGMFPAGVFPLPGPGIEPMPDGFGGGSTRPPPARTPKPPSRLQAAYDAGASLATLTKLDAAERQAAAQQSKSEETQKQNFLRNYFQLARLNMDEKRLKMETEKFKVGLQKARAEGDKYVRIKTPMGEVLVDAEWALKNIPALGGAVGVTSGKAGKGTGDPEVDWLSAWEKEHLEKPPSSTAGGEAQTFPDMPGRRKVMVNGRPYLLKPSGEASFGTYVQRRAKQDSKDSQGDKSFFRSARSDGMNVAQSVALMNAQGVPPNRIAAALSGMPLDPEIQAAVYSRRRPRKITVSAALREARKYYAEEAGNGLAPKEIAVNVAKRLETFFGNNRSVSENVRAMYQR